MPGLFSQGIIVNRMDGDAVPKMKYLTPFVSIY